jgi:hypothetical protein
VRILPYPYKSHPSMKNSVLTFRAPEALECITWPTEPTGCKNTSSAKRVPARFLSYPYRSCPRMKNSVSMFRAMDALRDTQIPPDAKIQFWRNVFWRAFCHIHTGPTWAWKIAHRRFVPWMHRNALRDPQIPPDAKTQVRWNVSQCTF